MHEVIKKWSTLVLVISSLILGLTTTLPVPMRGRRSEETVGCAARGGKFTLIPHFCIGPCSISVINFRLRFFKKWGLQLPNRVPKTTSMGFVICSTFCGDDSRRTSADHGHSFCGVSLGSGVPLLQAPPRKQFADSSCTIASISAWEWKSCNCG